MPNDMEAIQQWAEESPPWVKAAVILLIEHDHWLYDEGFQEWCVVRQAGGSAVFLDFHAMQQYHDDPENPGSPGQRVVLRAAADLGSGRWQVAVLDARNRDRLMCAVTTALVNRLCQVT